MLLDPSRVTLKFGAYGTAPATALTDSLLLPRVQSFRRQLGARMIAVDKETAKKKIPTGEYHISRKIDGEFTVVVVRHGEAVTLNPGGTVRTGMPMLAEALERVTAAGVKNALIVGELFVQRADKKRPRIHDVVQVARKPEKQADVDSLHLAVTDLIELDGREFTTDYAATWARINELFSGGTRVKPVETVTGNDKEIAVKFKTWVEKEGAEGVVARSDSAGIFKFKPRHSLDVAVIGFTEATEDRTGMLHDILLAVMRRDGTFHVLGRAGGGFSDEERKQILSDLNDIQAESDYAEINSDRVAYQMVKPKLVAEVSCLDLVSETTRGGTIDRMVLRWNRAASKWETIRRLPLVSVISPQFIRFRDDKQIHPADISIQQLLDLVDIPLSDKSAEELELPKSELLRRRVATKTIKDALMVRKIMLWKTNKEKESLEFPAYVVHATDFSPNRKTPLQREIRVSNSHEQITALFEALAAEYFVKGWNEVL